MHTRHNATDGGKVAAGSGQREQGDEQDERVAHIPRTSWTLRLLVNDTHPGQSVIQSRDSGTESKGVEVVVGVDESLSESFVERCASHGI